MMPENRRLKARTSQVDVLEQHIYLIFSGTNGSSCEKAGFVSCLEIIFVLNYVLAHHSQQKHTMHKH